MVFWGVAQTESQREKTAEMFLKDDGYEIYLPKLRASKREVPLFPGYLFVWIVDRWYSIENTIGRDPLIIDWRCAVARTGQRDQKIQELGA